MKKPFGSIKWKLVLLYAVLVVCVILVLALGIPVMAISLMSGH